MIPTQTDVVENIETGIKVWVTYTHYFEKSKESIHSRCLKTNGIQNISKENLKDVILNLYVVNPRRVRYSLYKIINFDDNNLIEMSDFIYKGDDIENIFQLRFPKIEGIRIDAGANIYVAENVPLMLIKKLTYRINSKHKR
jgi:hypothetical protein